MMNLTERVIISLVKSAIDGSCATVPPDVDWASVVELAERYKLVPLVCQGMTNSAISAPENIMATVHKIVLANLMLDQKQLYEISKLQKAFDENAIDYMPVKGILLKYLYPNTELRPMGDGDILIRSTQMGKIAPVMEQLGYTFAYESTHEWAFDKNGVHVELHKCLIPKHNKDYDTYFGDGWSLANKTDNGTRYAMRDEDHFLYIFTHFAKHYRDGGIGVLHMADLWVYTREKTLDETYVRGELEKLGLLRFYENVFETVRAWFEDGSASEMTAFVTQRIFQNGRFGTRNSRIMARGVLDSKTTPAKAVRLKQSVQAVFPGMDGMQQRYPILRKHAYLLPVMWVARWFDLLLFKRDRMRNKVNAIKMTTEDNVSAYQKELEYVGLDYNF